MNLARLRKNSTCSARIQCATAIGVINRMDIQLIALLMFLLLTYLLFRRPASSASKRLPTELNFQIGRPVYSTSEGPREKSAEASRRSGVNRSFLRNVALGSALIPLWGMFATAQTPADAQVRSDVAGDVSRSGREDKEDKKNGAATNDRAKNDKDNAELLEEMRQMRQLIERLEARVNQLEAEKS